MVARFPFSRILSRILTLTTVVSFLSYPLLGQRPGQRPSGSSSQEMDNQGTNLSVSVRDSHGTPLGIGALVHLVAAAGSYNVTAAVRDASTAQFTNLLSGDYEIEVTCPGYRKATERISILGGHVDMPVYIYMVPDSDPAPSGGTPAGVVMSPQLRGELEKALQALRVQQYETARKILSKASQKAPGNPDVVYFLGVAELGLQHTDLAREDFQKAISLNPNHELALISLGELQLKSGATADAIVSLEKATSSGHAGWRAHYQLAAAYFRGRRLKDAEVEASRAVTLAKTKGAVGLFLLGEIQYADGRKPEAKKTWESILTSFPSDPIADSAKTILARLNSEVFQPGVDPAAALPPPPAPDVSLTAVVQHQWAPPDLDSVVYDLAPQVECKTEAILDRALQHMKSGLVDFEKFTATEHIEHQQIDRYGWPGPVKSHDFSYIVLIYPLEKNSFYLEESRGGGGNDLANFPTSLATTGLNSLGVSVLQPYYREHFAYSCEGLTNLRGQAAWQVRFEEKLGAKGSGIRQWKTNGKVFDIPVKGRIWISSASYAVLRIETELRNPVAGLELTKDHLFVDYGPVKFSAGNEQLWLPWSAEMYMELHGKRYHHRHFLSDYMLFGIDTTNKISKPKEILPPSTEASP